jgi:ATP/maltotriose-dependent transcriptional regulator MalT
MLAAVVERRFLAAKAANATTKFRIGSTSTLLPPTVPLAWIVNGTGAMSSLATSNEFLPFELLVANRTADGYLVTVVESPGGEGEVRSTIDPAELHDALAALQAFDTDRDFLIDLGTFFFQELFGGDVGFLYRSSVGIARGQHKKLRVRLRINSPELAFLPWEYLYDAEEKNYLAISVETPLVRYIPAKIPVRPTKVNLPLRVLLVEASPVDAVPLDSQREVQIIRNALSELINQGRLQLDVVEQATLGKVNDALRQFDPHVFHFIGHALFEQERASLVLEGEQRQTALVDEQTVQALFAGSKSTRLAVLNACQSATLSATQPFVGMAPRLLQRQLSAVVAMQQPITDRAARVFANAFYQTLALGSPIDAAISEARKAIFLEVGSHTPEWGTPVLFLRAKDGQLFEIERKATPPLEIPPPPEPKGPPEIAGFVGRQAELNRYQEQLETGNLAVITGMAGVGKTALAATLAQSVAERQKIFWYSFTEQTALTTMIRDLAGFLAWHGLPELWKLMEGARLAGGKPPETEILFTYLLQLLRGGGFLLCLDNFQHVDEDLVLNQFLERIRQELAARQLVLIITSRRTPAFIRQTEFPPLAGLNAEDARQLLVNRGLVLSQTQVANLYAATHGNAEFLTLAIEALRQAAEPDYLIEHLGTTDDIERYLLNQVDAGLTGQERRVMAGIALFLGDAISRDALEAVLDSGNLFRVLLRLAERHLIVVRKAGDERSYTLHDIVGAYYYHQLGQERLRLHRRAGEYYRAEVPPDLLHASQHFQRAGDHAQAAQLATQDLWAIINRGEVQGLQRLLESFDERHLETPLWLEVKLACGELYSWFGQSVAARTCYQETLDQALALVNGEEQRRFEARVCRGLGELLEREQPQEAESWLSRGLTVLPPQENQQKAALLLQLGTVQLYLRKYQEAEQALEQGLALLPSGSSHLRCAALRDLGVIYSARGDLAQAQRYTQQALQLSEQVHDLFQKANLLSNMGVYHTRQFHWQAAIQAFQDALTINRRLGSDKQLAMVEFNLGATYVQLGEEAQAALHLYQSLALAEQTANYRTELFVRCRLAELELAKRQHEMVRLHLARAKQLVQQLAQRTHLLVIGRIEAELECSTGNLEAAEQLARQTIGLAEEFNSPEYLAINQRVLGLIELVAGNAAAIATLEQSLATLEPRNEYEAARTKVALARALLAIDVERSRGLLREARTFFERMAARRDLLELGQVEDQLSQAA